MKVVAYMYSAWKLFRRRNLYIYVMARVMAVLRLPAPFAESALVLLH